MSVDELQERIGQATRVYFDRRLIQDVLEGKKTHPFLSRLVREYGITPQEHIRGLRGEPLSPNGPAAGGAG